MAQFDEMEEVQIKIDTPTDTAVLGEGLDNKDFEVVVMKDKAGCPKRGKDGEYEAKAQKGAADAYAGYDVDSSIKVTPGSKIISRRYPVSIEPPAGTPPGPRAVGIWDKSLKKLVLCKDDAINLFI
jgi:hypothetical protein